MSDSIHNFDLRFDGHATFTISSSDGCAELGPHLGKRYNAKAVLDIMRRAYGRPTEVQRDRYGYPASIHYKNAVFNLDAVCGYGRHLLKTQLDADSTRERNGEKHVRRSMAAGGRRS